MSGRGADTAGPPTGGSAAPVPLSLHARIADTLERANLPLLASALTFDALLAVIPLAILLIAFLGYLVSSSAVDTASAADLIGRFLPQHGHGTGSDPFVLVEGLVAKLQGYRSKLTWFAIPLSLWFSTRVFGAVRVCLSRIFQVRQRPVKGHFVWSYVAGYLLAKAQDTAMVLVVLVLAVANTVTTTALTMTAARGVQVDPRWGFLLTTGGRLAGQGVAFLFGIALFVLLYRYASPKRLAWPGALLASLVGTVGFEIAKRLYGLYLAHIAHGGQFSFDADVGAAMLFILWLWYMSLVFLIGAAVADVWDHARQAKRVEGAVVTP